MRCSNKSILKQITHPPPDIRHYLSLGSTVPEPTFPTTAGHMGPVPIPVNNAEVKNLDTGMKLPSLTN